MTIPRNLACKDGLVYVPKHSRRTCCQSRYEWPYMHHKVIFSRLFGYQTSDIGGGQKSVFPSFLADFSARLVRSVYIPNSKFSRKLIPLLAHSLFMASLRKSAEALTTAISCTRKSTYKMYLSSCNTKIR